LYEQVKARFEKECFKVKNPFCYVHITEEKKLVSISYKHIAKYYGYLKYWKVNKKGKYVQVPFVNAWCKDSDIRRYECVEMNPLGNKLGEYNTWPGFLAEKIQPIADDKVMDLVAPIVQHIYEIFAMNNQEYTDWILDFFANIVKRPWQKTHVALCIVGLEGCGKTILLEWFRLKILGDTITHHTEHLTSNLSDMKLPRRFSNSLVKKVLIVGDDINFICRHDEGAIKSLMSADYTYRPYPEQRGYLKEHNYCNLILTSNNKNTIPPDDCRFRLFECSNKYMGNTSYFNNLAECLANPSVQRAFFQYLMARDLSAYPRTFKHWRK
jgi:hypothetical protein